LAIENEVLYGHTGNVSCVRFSKCGNFIYSNGEDNTFRVWDR
jgi:WD40 repeat protein